MATLRANGKEVLRIETNLSVKNSDLISDRRIRAYFENGVILEKRTVKFPADQYNPEGRVHTWGWKKILTAKAARASTVSVADRILGVRKYIADNPEKGWTIVVRRASNRPPS